MPSIDYNACAIDSPDFRHALLEHERQLEDSVKTMKSVIDSFKKVQETGRSYNEALVAFSQSIQKLGFDQQAGMTTAQSADSSAAQNQVLNLSKAEQDMARFAAQFAKDLRYIEDARLRWLTLSQESFLKVLSQQRAKIRDFLAESRRVYYEETKKFYHNQERTLGLKQQTGKNAEPRNWTAIDRDADAERLAYFNRTYDYVKTLQCEQAKNKVRFFEVIATLQSVWKCFYQECNDNLVEREKNMQATNESVANYNESIDVAERELEENRQKLLDAEAWRRQSGGEKQAVMEGYLLLLTQKKLSVTPNNWQRCYCTFNRQRRLLTMQYFSPGNPGRSDSSSSPTEGGLGGCVVSVGLPPNSEVDRRFLFEVEFGDSSTKTVLLQAYSSYEFQSWTRALRGDPASTDEALDSKQRPTEFEAQKVEACLTELDNRALDEEGLYRVEGRSKLVEDFVRGYIMGRPDGQGQVPPLDQVEVRVLSSSVKRYLKQLPEPLITYAVVDCLLQLLASTGIEAAALLESPEAVQSLRQQFEASLPAVNRRLILALMAHFNRLVNRSEINKMTAVNVAIVFAPTLCWPQHVNLQSMQACALAGRHLVLALMQQPDQLLMGAVAGSAERPSGPTVRSNKISPAVDQQQPQRLQQPHLPTLLGRSYTAASQQPNQPSNLLISSGLNLEGPKRCARTLYACVGDSPAELSFAANELVYDVQRIARVDGWCFGNINGRSGIIPSNYIQILQ